MPTKKTFRQRDSLLVREGTFPTVAGTPTYTLPLDLGPITPLAHRNLPMELLVSGPVMTAANLPAGVSMAYALEFSSNPEFTVGSIVTINVSDWAQTGSADGCDDLVRRFRPSTDALPYVRLKCTRTGTGGVLTDKKFSLEIVT